MEEEEPMRLNLACIYHYIKLAYFSYAYTAPGMFFVDLSHNKNTSHKHKTQQKQKDTRMHIVQ